METDSWTNYSSKRHNKKRKNISKKINEFADIYNYEHLELVQLIERKNSLVETLEDMSPNGEYYEELSQELEYIRLEIKRRYYVMPGQSN